MTRPDGLLGRVVADVRGQDVRTGPDGVGHVVRHLAIAVEIDQRRSTVIAVSQQPTPPPPEGGRPPEGWSSELPEGLTGLVGANVRSGFGRHLSDLLPDERDRRSLLYSALEDLGGALLVSGYSLLRGGAIKRSREMGEQIAQAQADICIGWASGGPLVESLRQNGLTATPLGPAAPAVEGDDPLSWHRMAPMATGTVRRRRRLDVAAPTTASEGEVLVVQSHFRDSYAGDAGETIMHEYLVDARVDEGQRLSQVAVDPRVLPWNECPGAAPSAHGVVGVAVDDIPARVRAELVGPTTCTHLNSTLRSLADIRALAQLLP